MKTKDSLAPFKPSRTKRLVILVREEFFWMATAHQIQLTGGVSPGGYGKGSVIVTGEKLTAYWSKSITTSYRGHHELEVTEARFFQSCKKNSQSKLKKVSDPDQVRKPLTIRGR